jgi:hypothetical protein
MIDPETRMIRIEKLIADLQEIKRKFGNTCVYIHPRGMSWGAVALNYQDEDEKAGVFDLQKAYDRDRQAHKEQVDMLIKERDEWRRIAFAAMPSAD